MKLDTASTTIGTADHPNTYLGPDGSDDPANRRSPPPPLATRVRHHDPDVLDTLGRASGRPTHKDQTHRFESLRQFTERAHQETHYSPSTAILEAKEKSLIAAYAAMTRIAEGS